MAWPVAAGANIDIVAVERDRVVRAADRYLKERPITITASSSQRSAGGKHDYFSEGDYWWPDPQSPNGPYVQRDGMTNPDNFVAHRHALIRLSLQMPALTAAWSITKNKKYARHAAEHLRAWFVAPATRMNPDLQYAQAIQGRTTGRGIGIIDTIHLVEVARAIPFLSDASVMSESEQQQVKQWFSEYLQWMTTSRNGIEEREAKNNHGTCWVMQVAQFAQYTGNQRLIAECSERYKTVLLPDQLASDGSFPLELKRTKPYSYSLFNLDAMATICKIVSTPRDDLWTFALADGRSMRKAMAFMAPYIADKKSWPHPADVQYADDFPVRQPSLLFAGLAYNEPSYLGLWSKLNPDPVVDEVIRNFPIRQPVLWAQASK
ncbi:MAG: alginate lyase family protein [Steroidobacter sp.]